MSTVMGQIASVSVEIGGKEITFETGKLAKQADGAVVMRSGDTMVLATAVGRPEAREGADFFPLTIDVEERAYAAGKIPGGFFKREGRATERATLTARMIDRPIRPLWPKGFRNEVQVICTVLSADLVTPHDILCINGASAALMLSPLPFFGPVGAVRVGRIDGEFVLNPTHEQNFEETSLDLIVVGTKDGLTMVEAGADEVPEDVLLEALALAHEEIKKLCEAQEDLRRQAGKAKWLDLELTAEIEGSHGHSIWERIQQDGLREAACDRVGAPRRARAGALDGLERRGHPAPGSGQAEPRDAAREAAARRGRGSGAGAVRVGSAGAHRRGGRLEGAQVREAAPALRQDRRHVRAAVPGRTGDGRRRRRRRSRTRSRRATSRRPPRRSTRTSSARRSRSTSGVPTAVAPRRSGRSSAR